MFYEYSKLPILLTYTRSKHTTFNNISPFFYAVPTANTRALDIRTRTTYDKMYNDTSNDVRLQARDVSRLVVPEVIKMQHEKAFAHGQFTNFVNSFQNLYKILKAN